MRPGARCVVLAGGGFIGSNLRLALARSGATVTGFGRPPRYAVDAGSWIDGDFEDGEAMARAVAGASHVFHLFGSADPGRSNDDPGEDARRIVPASLRVLEACRDAGVGKLVFLSSGGTVYRPGLPLPIAEDAPTDPVSAYGIGKLSTEKYCALFRHLYDLDTTVLRVANPFGPYQSPDRGQGFVAKLIARALRGEPIEIWGDGGIVRDFLFIDDAVAAMIAAAAHPGVAGPLNIGSGVGRTIRSVVEDVRELVDRDVELVFRPARAADTPANVLDITRAAVEIGWRPVTGWLDGLRATRDWLSRTSMQGVTSSAASRRAP